VTRQFPDRHTRSRRLHSRCIPRNDRRNVLGVTTRLVENRTLSQKMRKSVTYETGDSLPRFGLCRRIPSIPLVQPPSISQRRALLTSKLRWRTILDKPCSDPYYAGTAFSRRRCTEFGIRSASRYFATVRRAISTPSCRSTATIASSDRISAAGSRSIRPRMR
jgi:hypothetical protein